MKKIITLLVLCIAAMGHAQSLFNMPTGNNGGAGTSFVTCSGSFNDSGQQNNYGNNENGLATFCPGISTDRMQLNFLQMNILSGDVLTIFDGSTPAAPVLATITNTTTAPGLIQASATNPTGCLTVRFTSNGTGNAAGWRAAITCFNPCQTITPTIITTPATSADNILRICQGQQVGFNGTAAFSVSGAGASYTWDLGNGGGIVTGQTQTETYTTPGVYFVRFTVTDPNGCFDRQLIDLTIQVSTDPSFAGTGAAANTICFGDSTTITGVVTPQQFALSPSPPLAGTTFLPDGNGVSYQTCVNVDLFPAGSTMTSASDLVNIFLNMEHSFLGDLNISVTAPNGATISLHNFPSGGGTFLGQPIDIDTNLNPGVGFDYVFTEAPTATRTWAQWVTQVGGPTVPAGNYRPVNPFSTFIGSPLNGQWCINITDNLGSDNGFIFFWGLNFNPSRIPPALSFTPGVASRNWLPDPSITSTAGNVITVQPTTAGLNCYNYQFIDSFGCTYTEQVCITVQPEITSATPPDIIVCALPGTGNPIFNLRQDELVTLNGLNAALYTITYHTTLAGAQNGTNPITTPDAYTSTANPETIFVSVRDNVTQCRRTHSFVISSIDFGTISIDDFEQCAAIANFDLVNYVTPFLTSVGGGTSTAAFTISFYDTLLNAQGSINPITNPASYTPTTNPVTIYIRIQSNNEPTCFSIQPFDLIGLGLPVATQPANLVACDESGTGALTANFVFDTLIASILNGQNPAAFNVSFHDSQANADTNVSPLNATSYTNTAALETIFVRVENANATECFDTTSFTVQVDPQAQFNTVNDLELCDDLTNDGIESFNLDAQTAGILGSQNPTDFVVTYHETAADATANTAAITSTAAYSNISNPQTIFVRVTPVANATCFETGTFTLTVNEQAVANTVTPLVLCDDASNDGFAVFDLTASIAEVLGTQDPSVFNVTIHTSQADADANANPVSTSFTNTSTPQVLYARVENNASTSCFATTTIDLLINEAPRITAPSNLVLCDDPSGDGVEVFNLAANNTALLNGLNPANFTISYHASQNNADNGIAPLATSYTNTTSPETIFVRVVNDNTGCVNTTSFQLVVNPIPAIVPVNDLEVCDDDLNGSTVFRLSDRTVEIINNRNNHRVVYYASNSDAVAGANGLNDTSYTNTSNPQDIFYRLVNDNTGCFAIGSFIIEAVAAPVAIVPAALANCDDGTGNAQADLDSRTAQIIGNQTGLTVTYHDSQSNANSGSSALTSPYTYRTNETIFVRVEDLSSGCASFTTLALVFNPLPNPQLLEEYILCRDAAGVLLNGPAILNTGLDNATFSFEWTLDGVVVPGATSAILNAVEPGDYEVITTNRLTGCSNFETTTVRQAGAPQIFDVQVTTDPFSLEHRVIATASGPDTYWFRLDDGPYEDSGRFDNVPPGPHTVTIAERNGCGEIIIDIFVYGYPDYFTPNNDGFHDTWNIIGGDRLPGTKLYIFDRFGKLLKQLDPSGPGWDGTYNGQPLPSADYWFRIEYVFENRAGEASGHFAMKR